VKSKKGGAVKVKVDVGSESESESEGEKSEEELPTKKSRKRPSSALVVNSDDDNDEDEGGYAARGSSSTPRDDILNDSDAEDEAEETSLSSPHLRSSQSKRRKLSNHRATNSDSDTDDRVGVVADREEGKVVEMKDFDTAAAVAVDEGDEDVDEDAAPVARPARQRTRAGFVVDSSDEE